MAEAIVKKRTYVATPIVSLDAFNNLKTSVDGHQQWINGNNLTEAQQDETFRAYKAKIDAFEQTAAGRLETAEGKLAKLEPELNDVKTNVTSVKNNVLTMQNNVSAVQNTVTTIQTKLVDVDKSLANTDENFEKLGMGTIVSAIAYASKTFELPYAEPVSSMEYSGKTAELVDENGNTVIINVNDSGALFGGDLVYQNHPMGGLVLTNMKFGTYRVIVAKFRV